MITFHNPLHHLHAPVHEFFRGERVPCFEKPARADYVESRLTERGHALLAPDQDSSAVLERIHAPRYLQFLQTAWSQWLALDLANATVQPFPSVWPVRTLRSDMTAAHKRELQERTDKLRAAGPGQVRPGGRRFIMPAENEAVANQQYVACTGIRPEWPCVAHRVLIERPFDRIGEPAMLRGMGNVADNGVSLIERAVTHPGPANFKFDQRHDHNRQTQQQQAQRAKQPFQAEISTHTGA